MTVHRHRYTLVIPFGDCDPAGMVFYPNFCAWMDEGSWGLLRSAGITRKVINDTYGALGCPLAAASMQFRAPAHDGDELTVESWIVRWGTSSFDVAHRFSCEGRDVADGKETRVWAVRDGGSVKAAPIPDAVRALLGDAADDG